MCHSTLASLFQSQTELEWERSGVVAMQLGLACARTSRTELLRPSGGLPPLSNYQSFTSINISQSAIASEITSSLLQQMKISQQVKKIHRIIEKIRLGNTCKKVEFNSYPNTAKSQFTCSYRKRQNNQN